MLVECKRCGATLDIKPKAKRAKCRYCGAVDDRERLRAISAETPKDFTHPKEWTPPPGREVEAGKPLPDRGDDSTRTGLIMALVLFALVAGTVWAATTKVWYAKPERVALGSPIGKPQDVAARLGGSTPNDRTVHVNLRSDRYEDVELRYASASDTVPESIDLETARRAKADPAACKTLGGWLNGGFQKDNWDWDQVNLTCTFARVPHESDSALRERRMKAAWGLIMAAHFESSVKPSDQEMRDVMGGGWPITTLLKIPASTTVDKVKGVAHATCPGALVDDDHRMRITVALDHPYFRDVLLEWTPAVGGTLATADFHPRTAFAANQEHFATCLEQTLGAPEVHVRDPIKNTKGYYFHVGHDRVNVDAAMDVRGGSSIDDATWTKVVQAMDACR
jgi:hypothetical protein